MPLTSSTPKLHYEINGDTGTPVLFVMGYGMRGMSWQPQIEGIAAHHRCCIYDHPGIGGSEQGRFLMTTRRLAQHALRLLDELEWPYAHVVGVSMGGMVSQELALLAGRRLKSLALIATHSGRMQSRFPTAKGVGLFLRVQTAAHGSARIRALQSLLYPPDYLGRTDQKALSKRLRDQLGQRPPSRTLFGQYLAVMRHRTTHRLNEIEVPTLVVRPGRDILVRPNESDHLHARLPRSSLVNFEDAGHGITFQARERLNTTLLSHFQQADAT